MLAIGIGILFLQHTYFILLSGSSVEYGMLIASNPFYEGHKSSEAARFE